MNHPFSDKISSEASIIQKWRTLYPRLRESRRGAPVYRIQHVPLSPHSLSIEDLHSHVMKDAYLKHLSLHGGDVISIPCWNHYAPGIELPISDDADLSVVWQEYSQQVQERIEQQRQYFIDLGVFADWDAIQKTVLTRLDGKLANLLRQFQEAGYLARRERPGYWCVQCQTVLSSDELEFREEESLKSFVLFPVHVGLEAYGSPLYLMACIHELWMLPGVSAITVQSDQRYVVISADDKTLVTSLDSLDKLLDDDAFPLSRHTEYRIVGEFSSAALATCTCMLPLQGVELPVILVTDEQPWAIMSVAPGHSFQDYVLSRKHQMEIRSAVDVNGVFTDEANQLCGVHMKDANRAIQGILERYGYLVHYSSERTARPYCWRCHQPAIFRPAMQWILQPEGGNLSRRLYNATANIKWDNPRSSELINTFFSESTDWSITRKRIWGVPFPVLYCDGCGEPLSVSKTGKNIRDFISRKGLQTWFSQDIMNILPRDMNCSHCGGSSFRKEQMVLRPDFASAIYQLFHQQSQSRSGNLTGIYAEPLRQHGQWFAIWMLTAIAHENLLPSKSLCVYDTSCDIDCIHHQERMSLEQLRRRPLDETRLWLLCHEPWEHIREVVHRLSEVCWKLFEGAGDTVPQSSQADPFGRYLLDRFYQLQQEVDHDYERFSFDAGLKTILDFCNRDLADFYVALTAPILSNPDLKYHTDVRQTFRQILMGLIHLLAPVTPVLAEQIWSAFGNESSIFLKTIRPDEMTDHAGARQNPVDTVAWQTLRHFHAEMTQILSSRNAEGILKVYLGESGPLPLYHAYLELRFSPYESGAFEIVDMREHVPDPQPLEAICNGFFGWQGE